MSPDPKRDTSGQLSRKGQEAEDHKNERERGGSAAEKEAKKLADDLEARYRSSNSDTAGVQNSQGGTGGGNLGGPGNFGGGSLDSKPER